MLHGRAGRGAAPDTKDCGWDCRKERGRDRRALAAQAGGFVPSGAGLWAPLAETLCAWARAEAGAGRLLPWVPVAFGAGIALCFSVDREPVLPVAVISAIGVCVAAFLARRYRFFPVLVMVAAVVAGFATATWKTAHVWHVVLARPIYSVALSGFVETRDIRDRTDRFVLRVTRMEGARNQPTLERVRLSVKKGTAPDVGSFVELKARLSPPLAPLRPGGYDFSRDLFFRASARRVSRWARSRSWRRRKAVAWGCATRRSCRACATRSMPVFAPALMVTSDRSPPRFWPASATRSRSR